ncbi:hypothetical protein PHMEG_00013871 [Phytophthora megakarya]|uniref:Uncharacterized protein n=1 Tax=Phytophthora megakarya TaxID=4795 RepID=A0A225W562_9STRA|nr:hypothetical protein PHMEG_00013871 [Phytophthora megakarya]
MGKCTLDEIVPETPDELEGEADGTWEEPRAATCESSEKEASNTLEMDGPKKPDLLEDEADLPSVDQLVGVLRHLLQAASNTKPRVQTWLDLAHQQFEGAAKRLPNLTLMKNDLNKLVGQYTVKDAEAGENLLSKWTQKLTGAKHKEMNPQNEYKTFMFNQAAYSTEETSKLRKLFCRRLPQFLHRIMNNDDRLKRIMTIRAQMEVV